MDSNEIIKRVRERVYREVKKNILETIWILVFKMYYIIVQKHI